MTKLEEKFLLTIEFAEHSDQPIKAAAYSCSALCKEQMKKFDVWKEDNGWRPVKNTIGIRYYNLTGEIKLPDQLIALYESENQEGENKQ